MTWGIRQEIALEWQRLVNPARRFLVVLRYEGIKAALRLLRSRFATPLVRRSTTKVSVTGPGAQAVASVHHFISPMAPQIVTPPATRRVRYFSSPSVSVIVRTYNRPTLLAQALTSLANQTFADFEVVVVNDGEADIGAVLEHFEPFLVLRQASHRQCSGRSAALNSALAAARGRWITYLDDDDLVYPFHLEQLVQGLSDTQRQVAYSDAYRALCLSDASSDVVVQLLPCAALDFDFRRLIVDNWIPLMTFMHAADCLDTVGLFDEHLDLFEDWDFLIRTGQRYAFVHFPQYSCEYRYRFGPLPDKARSALRTRERVLEATRLIYDRYSVSDRELIARRRLTLSALQQDIEEVRRIEARVVDPMVRDLLITARVGRFQNARALAQRYSSAAAHLV